MKINHPILKNGDDVKISITLKKFFAYYNIYPFETIFLFRIIKNNKDFLNTWITENILYIHTYTQNARVRARSIQIFTNTCAHVPIIHKRRQQIILYKSRKLFCNCTCSAWPSHVSICESV